MANVKKSTLVLKHFVLILTFLFFESNSFAQYEVYKIEGKQINLNDKSPKMEEYDKYILPFKTNIDKDLNTVLAISPETLDKSKGLYQTNIGDLLADIMLLKANVIFKKRENLDIDISILNHGGIRATLPKGDVTTRTAFEIMPFENTVMVIALKGKQIEEFVEYFIQFKKPHPISGITFTIDSKNKFSNIMVKDKPLDLTKTYYVVTTDYLANGGDNMIFFNKSEKIYDLDYKLRNILIDYFKDVDSIPISKKIKILQKK